MEIMPHVIEKGFLEVLSRIINTRYTLHQHSNPIEWVHTVFPSLQSVTRVAFDLKTSGVKSAISQPFIILRKLLSRTVSLVTI